MNASRVQGVSASGGQAKPIALGGVTYELTLNIHLETKQVGPGPVRKTPHLVCTSFLPELGKSRKWSGARTSITPESALDLTFESLRKSLAPVGDKFALTLPEYLTPAQVKAVLDRAVKAKLTVTGSAAGAVAIAAHRADSILAPKAESMTAEEKPEWVVPLRTREGGPGVVVIIDVDESALFASAVQIEARDARHLTGAHWPRAARKLWTDRLVDAISDRCVRLCRRDPRDSAEAEQGLYDQFEVALESSRRGHLVKLIVRADKWYQDLTLSPADFEGFTDGLAKVAAGEVRELIASLGLPVPPRAIWLSTKAAQLPGLAAMLHRESPEGTDVAVLPNEAAAEAAAALDARIRGGVLGANHYEASIPLPAKSAMKATRTKSS